jgi:hypothetical protein
VVTLIDIIGFLQSKIIPPGWIGNYAPDGVLYHHGWAAQEMPRNEKKGGYVHGLRDIAPQGGLNSPAKQFYETHCLTLPQPILFLPQQLYLELARVGTLEPLEANTIAEFYDITFHRYFSAELVLTLPEEPTYAEFVNTYGKGNCFVYQSLIMCPESEGSNKWHPYQYTEVNEIRRAHKLANESSGRLGLEGNLYFNVGLNSNSRFFDNTLDFKFRYPQRKFVGWWQASSQSGIPATYVPGSSHPLGVAELAIGFDPALFPASVVDRDVLMVVGTLFFFTPLPDPSAATFVYPNPSLDVTHPDVVRLALADIRNHARQYGNPGADELPVANFIIGGEFTVGVSGPTTAPGNPATGLVRFQLPITSEDECRHCQPLAPYSPELDQAFREYLKEIVGLVAPSGSLDMVALNARWGLTGTQFEFNTEDDVEPSQKDWCKELGNNYKAVEDYRAFIELLERDVYIIQYVEAKKYAVRGRHGMRGPFSAEQCWLNSDMLQTGAWYASQIEIEQPLERALYYMANQCRIGGKPAGFPITSPPSTESEGSLTEGLREIWSRAGRQGYAVPPDVWLNGDPSAKPPKPKASSAFEPRCISREHFFWLYHDILTAGVCAVGYYRLYGYGLYDSEARELRQPSSPPGAPGPFVRSEPYDGVQTFFDILQEFKNEIQPKYLRFMTPYQRIALHLDEYQLVDYSTQAGDGTMRFVASLLPWLDEHHYTYAMVSDPRVFVRLFSKHTLRASVTISPFHKDLDANLMARYVGLVAGSPGIVVVLTDDAGYARITSTGGTGAGPLGPVDPMPAGVQMTQWEVQAWDDAVNPHVFVYRIPFEINVAGDELTVIQHELDQIQFPKVAARVVDVALAGTPVESEDVRTNFVTDGLNYLVALTSVNQLSVATGTLSLAAAMRINSHEGGVARYWYDVDQVTTSLTDKTMSVMPTLLTSQSEQQDPTRSVDIDFTLQPRETKLIYLGAQVSDLETLVTEMQATRDAMRDALLGMEAEGYETSAGLRALDYLDDMLGPATQAPLERVLAGLVQVKNTIFLKRGKESVGRSTFRVTAARLGLPDPATLEPVSGEVQILHVLNGHEEQSAGDLSGSSSVVTIGPTTLKHWDFGQTDGTPKFMQSLTGNAPGRDPVEVHVHDPARGTESFLLVPGPPREPVLPPTVIVGKGDVRPIAP